MATEYEIVEKRLDPQSTLARRTLTNMSDIAQDLGRIFPAVFELLEKKSVRPSGPPFTRYHTFSADEVDIEGGIPTEDQVEAEGFITGNLPGGTVLSTMHIGHYDDLKNAHAALRGWIESNRLEQAGAPWEIYWTDPGEVMDPSEWKTEVVYPISI